MPSDAPRNPTNLAGPATVDGRAGNTLVEAVVALALLLTVLLPLSSTALALMTSHRGERHMAALALGRSVMERTLAERAFESQDLVFEAGKWRVSRDVERSLKRVTIVVRVYRGAGNEPLLRLVTVRAL